MNHSAIFSILRLYGFPDADIVLMIRLYDHTFLFIGNSFGNSAACILSRGAPQGADPSPVISNTAFNMIHVIARVCARGCTAHGPFRVDLAVMQTMLPSTLMGVL